MILGSGIHVRPIAPAPLCYNCTMLIGIDAREIQDGVFTGIGRALNNFLRYFGKLEDEHRCLLFSEKALPVEYGPRISSTIAPHSPAKLLWDQFTLAGLIKQSAVDLFYSPYYKVPLTAQVTMVSTVFDLMYIYYPISWRGTGFFSRETRR